MATNNNHHNRLNQFFSEESFDFIQDIASEYIEQMLNSKIWLYQIDKQRTPTTVNFKEAHSNEITYKDPVSLFCIVEIEESENSSYADSQIRYEEMGNINCHILLKHIKENQMVLNYGDIIAYQIYDEKFLYFKNVDPNFLYYSNEKSWAGFKPYFRTIKGVSLNQDEIEFLL